MSPTPPSKYCTAESYEQHLTWPSIGESLRPVSHPYLVKGAYGVSWLYLTGDVCHEGYKAYIRNQKILHPELYMKDESQKKSQKVSEGSKSVVGTVQDLAKKATSTEGVKSGGEGSVLSGEKISPGHIPAIEDYRAVMAQRAVFQAVASMGLPAFTIHSIVRYSGRALKDVKNKTLRTWGPVGVSTVNFISVSKCSLVSARSCSSSFSAFCFR
jgi:fission process protein 1